MDDMPFPNDGCDMDAFAAVVFDGDDDDDDLEDVLEDVDCTITDEGDFSDVDSFGSVDDVEDQRKHEHEQGQEDSNQNNGHVRRQSTSSIHAQQRRRSKYEARRCKSVDIMTERFMTHADDFDKNNKRSRFLLSKAFWCCCLAIIVMATTGAILALKPHLQLGQPRDDNSAVETGIDNADNLPSQISADVYGNADLENVPFANHHNLRFDGVLFVTNSNSEREAESTHGTFDSYAKTLGSITEVHFAPGESDTTKRIVLTTTQPDLMVNNLAHQNTNEMMDSDPGLVLSIGLEADGEVWLPITTGQMIPSLDSGWYGSEHHKIEQRITRNIYGPGDRFVLAVTDDAISLTRNDDHELVGMWMNPFITQSKVQPLYAQIWFKDTKSSMVATAWNDYR